MDPLFEYHNQHRMGPAAFAQRDPHLRQLQTQPLIHRAPLLDTLRHLKPGIYTLSGGRQIGKTSLLKQWMAELLELNVAPSQLLYLTGELIDDHHALVRLLTLLLREMTASMPKYILLDEVTYIKDWDRGVKFLADAGVLEDVIFLLTGSDLVLIQEARMRLPGRRGQGPQVDFHLFPLSFAETVELKGLLDPDQTSKLRARPGEPASRPVSVLFDAFDDYLKHGGFLTAINDLARDGTIHPATFQTYSDWIRGDVLKRGKSERNLRELLTGVLKHYLSQLTWNNLARELSIEHPATIADYVSLLESMDVLFVQAALLEDKLVGAPRKARRVVFNDPFILHAIRSWLEPTANPFDDMLLPTLKTSEWAGRLAEGCAIMHFRRRWPTFYIKARGEVDIAYIDRGSFWPVEIKWTGQVRPGDLKQLARYPNGMILDRLRLPRTVRGIPAYPLPWALFSIGSRDGDGGTFLQQERASKAPVP